MEPFRGFKYQTPTYTVITPHTGESYGVKSLTVGDIRSIKQSSLTPSKLTESLNDLIYTAIVSKPDRIKNMPDFLKNVTLKDRDALLYGVYHCTFGDETEFDVACEACGHKQKLKANISSMFKMNAFPGSKGVQDSYQLAKITNEADEDWELEEEIRNRNIKAPPPGLDMPEEELQKHFPEYYELHYGNKEEEKEEDNRSEVSNIFSKIIPITLPVSGVRAYLKQPTLQDERELLNSVPFSRKNQIDTLYETMIIDQFEEIHPKTGNILQTVKGRQDIMMAYKTLPPRDHKAITDEFTEQFGQYGIELTSSYTCVECGHENELFVDITAQFFRMVRGY